MSETQELAQRHVDIFNGRAWGRAQDTYDPEVVMVEPASTTRGVGSYLQLAQGFVTAFPDCRMEVSAVLESGNLAVIEGVYSGTHTGVLATPQGEVPPTGRTLALPLCDVFEIAAGRIVSIRAYYDQMAFAAQLGLLPDSAPTG